MSDTRSDQETVEPFAGRYLGAVSVAPDEVRSLFSRIPLREVLGFLRSLPATVFQLEKKPDGRFYWKFYEGELAEQTGFKTANMRGRSLFDVHPPRLPPDLPDRVALALQGELQKEVYQAGDRFLKLYLQRGVDSLGTPTDTVDGAVTDVTQRVLAVRHQKALYQQVADRNERLAQARRQTEQLNYTLSHDLRNPLTVVLTMCEVLQREIESGTGDPIAGIQKIRAAGNRMNEMLTDILKLSRSERAAPEPRLVDLSSVADEVLRQLGAGQPGRRVEYRVQPGIKVYADPNLLRDLMENLLSNAWKYTMDEDEPRIEVVEKVHDGKRWVSVVDNGIGFRDEDKEDLFLPFKRLPGAHGFQGTGVGLATAKRIVERHEGQIKAIGHPGEGAEFRFFLPGPEIPPAPKEGDPAPQEGDPAPQEGDMDGEA